jgi:pantoate--beta-alanine ligase
MTTPILRQRADLRGVTAEWHRAGERVAVVPTMGALHEGHLSLVKAARAAADRVIVTIFVNPRQFNNAQDLESYPRTEQEDARKLAPFSVDALYVPDLDQVYPDGFSTNISVSGVSEGLCGANRPGHFDGVATVVTKLFLQTDADLAFFGEKDFQQLQVVTRLARDLDIPVQVTGCPTVREADGLALSSRNVRLSARARGIAPALFAAMSAAAGRIAAGAPIASERERAKAEILKAGFAEVEYLELRAEDGLAPLPVLTAPARLLAAAWLDGVRLIDNIPVAPAG